VENKCGDGEVTLVISRRLVLQSRVAAAFLLLSLTIACSSQPANRPPSPEVILQAIPAGDPAQYERVSNMKQWRNPYLIVRTDGVALYDSADSAEIILKPDEVLTALARLPASYWPYGRVVAATETAVRTSEQDGVAIRRNKGIVGGMLEGAQVAIKWVPAR
jgi:hypothetical protein